MTRVSAIQHQPKSKNAATMNSATLGRSKMTVAVCQLSEAAVHRFQPAAAVLAEAPLQRGLRAAPRTFAILMTGGPSRFQCLI